MLARLVPAPLLSLTLTVVWLVLVNKVTLGNLLLGGVLGLADPDADRPLLARTGRRCAGRSSVVEYVLIVVWDIVVANVAGRARSSCSSRNRDIRSHWIAVPLDAAPRPRRSPSSRAPSP